MIGEPRRAAEDEGVAMGERHRPGGCGAAVAAEQEDRRQAERDRDDRLAEVALVAVLVKRQPRTRLVEIDQAGIGREPVEAGA